MSMPIAYAYAAELVPEGEEGRYMGSMNLAMFAGMGLGPLIGGSLMDFFSMSVPFYVMGAFTGLSLVLAMAFLPEDAQRHIGVDRPRASYGEIFSNRLLRAAFVYRAVSALGRGCIMSFLSMYMSNSLETGGLGIPISITGMVLSFGQISAALLQQPFGVLADRYDKVYLTLLGGFFGAFGLALFPLANDAWSVMAARLVFSVGSATGMPALTAIVAIEGRDKGMGTTMSVLQIAMSLGMIVGPLLFGILGDAFGLRPIFYYGGLITVAGTIAFYVLLKLR
jgi:DHA1 family multidrug resistance protein-like MFS transporter